jgi:hydrogenase maturation factor
MSAAAELACGSQHCITCGDDGDPMTVLRVDSERGLALCSAPDGARATVETALVEPVAVGERLLVHAGTAIARLGQAGDDRAAA